MKCKLNMFKKLIGAMVLASALTLGSMSVFAAATDNGHIDYANETINVAAAGSSYSFDGKTWTTVSTTNNLVSISKVIKPTFTSFYTKGTDGVISYFAIPGRPTTDASKMYFDAANNGTVFGTGNEAKIGTADWATAPDSTPGNSGVDVLAPGSTILVRKAAVTDTSFAGTVVNFKAIKRPAAPNVTLDMNNYVLKGTTTNMKYVLINQTLDATTQKNAYTDGGVASCTQTTTDLSSKLLKSAGPIAAQTLLVWTDAPATGDTPRSLQKVFQVTPILQASPLVDASFTYDSTNEVFSNATTLTLEYSTNDGVSFVAFPKTGLPIATLTPKLSNKIVLIRVKATATAPASAPYTLTITPRGSSPAIPGVDTTDATAVTLTGTADGQISLDNGKTWSTYTETSDSLTVALVPANKGKTALLRSDAGAGRATTTITPNSASVSVVLPKAQAAAPAVKADYSKGIFAGIKNTMEYSVTNVTPATAFVGNTLAIPTSAATYTFRYKQDAGKAVPSLVTTIVIPAQADDTAVASLKQIVTTANGKVVAKITGATSAMEFRPTTRDTVAHDLSDSTVAWTKYSDAAFQALFPTSADLANAFSLDVVVRVAGTATALPSQGRLIAGTAASSQTLAGAKVAITALLTNATAPAAFLAKLDETLADTDVMTEVNKLIKNPNITATWSTPFVNTVLASGTNVAAGGVITLTDSAEKTSTTVPLSTLKLTHK